MKIKSCLSFIFSAILVVALSFSAFASEGKPRLIDNAQLLDASEFKNLSSKLDEISERQQMDIVILTEKSIGGKSARDYAGDYFDYNNYGIGEDKSGVLLLINMEERDRYMSTKGYAVKAFTDAGINYISEKILPELKDGDYNGAFENYADLCDEFITKAKTDKPYDTRNLPKKEFDIRFWIPAAIVAGLVASWLTTLYMKKQLKTVLSKPKADDYIQKDSLKIKNHRDIFLYSSIVRHARPKSRSGGSSTHRSSSGSIHGGGGGKF